MPELMTKSRKAEIRQEAKALVQKVIDNNPHVTISVGRTDIITCQLLGLVVELLAGKDLPTDS